MMPRSPKFEQYYERLNPEQRAAVDAIEGPVFVIAGPGTGKTEVLTLRIANILQQTDTPPDGILALTFTNAGVAAMRARLGEIAGPAGHRVTITTFHGFCNELIQCHPAEFPRLIGGRAASRAEQVKIMEAVLAKLPLKKYRPSGAPFYYLPGLLSAIDRWKKDNLRPAEKELALIYRAYEKELAAGRLYDFADMIREVVNRLKKKPKFLLGLQEEYLYLLADEHQDANQAQNELLLLLADYHPSPNLFIVGDEKQAIFQFQGASLENFTYFKKRFPAARLISLSRSYRAGQPLLDAAHSLISQSNLPAPLLTPLQAGPGASTARLRVAALANPAAERHFLIAEIKAQLATGVPASQIALIYRDNAEGALYLAALEQAGLPAQSQTETDLLTDETISKLILLLEAIHHFGNDYYLKRLLQLDFLKLDSLVVYELLQTKTGLYQALKKEAKTNSELGRLFQKLEAWQRLAHNTGLLAFFNLVLSETGFLADLLRRPAAEEGLLKLQAFQSELGELARLKTNCRLADFIDQLETLRRHDLKLSAAEALAEPAGVQLLTAHKSKGLEFDHVYLAGATANKWGERRRPAGGVDEAPVDPAQALESERRLFYVALTRARRSLTVSYAIAARDGRSQAPAQFVSEINEDLIELVPPPAQLDPLAFLQPRPTPPNRLKEKAYLNQLFLERGLSVTDLNSYLRCPRQYFYANLLCLWPPENQYQIYGTAIHQALKEFFDAYRAGQTWPLAKLLGRLKLDDKGLLAKGKKALAGYYKTYKAKWPRLILNEFNVREVWLDKKLKLRGRIDKLEIDEADQTVCVVDYKTGAPKSRNHLLGQTKAEGSGDYFRQLVFYKLLLDHFEEGKYQVRAGLIDFIEPDAKGRYHQERFELTGADVKNLTTQIKQAAAEILDLEFFRHGCEKPDCEYCQLYRLANW